MRLGQSAKQLKTMLNVYALVMRAVVTVVLSSPTIQGKTKASVNKRRLTELESTKKHLIPIGSRYLEDGLSEVSSYFQRMVELGAERRTSDSDGGALGIGIQQKEIASMGKLTGDRNAGRRSPDAVATPMKQTSSCQTANSFKVYTP